jgi:hypothetical protein
MESRDLVSVAGNPTKIPHNRITKADKDSLGCDVATESCLVEVRNGRTRSYRGDLQMVEMGLIIRRSESQILRPATQRAVHRGR